MNSKEIFIQLNKINFALSDLQNDDLNNYSDKDQKKINSQIDEIVFKLNRKKEIFNEFTTNGQSKIKKKIGLKQLSNFNQIEESYKITIEKTGQIIYDLSRKRRFSKWEGAIEQLTGYSNDEFQKVHFSSFVKLIHPGDKKSFTKIHKEALKKIGHYYIEYRIKRKDGNYIYIQDNGVYILGKDNELRILGAIADISNRRNTEQLLLAKERSYRLLKDIAILSNKAPTNEEVLRTAMATISGYTKWPVGHAIIIYNNKYHFKFPQSYWYPATSVRYNDMIKNGENSHIPELKPIHIKAIIEKKAIWVSNIESITNYNLGEKSIKLGLKSLMILPVFIAGEVVSLIEMFSKKIEIGDEYLPDIMEQIGVQLGIIIERKTVEEDLKKLSMAIEQNHASVVITDINGIIEYTNPKFTEVSGFSSEEAYGKKPGVLKSGLHNIDFYNQMWDTIKSGEIWQGEICNKKKNGQLYWEQMNISPIKNLKGEITHFVAVKDDITEKRQQAEELKHAKELAESANRSKSEFLANMSHEIRTPMNAVLGFSELLSTKIVDEQQRNYLESIKSSGKTLLTLINDVLDLSKVDAGQMILHNELIDPFLLFKDIEYLFSLKAKEKEIDFKIKTDLSLPIAIEIDEVRLRQIMINLIGNALKFTEKGFVTVTVQCKDRRSIENNDFIDIEIIVEDSGIGINKNFQEIIFMPFTQQDGQSTKKYGGTGLGLTITKRFVELLNGTILLESEPGKGSRFILLFKNVKASQQKLNATEINTINPHKIKFYPATILIADDVENNRKYLMGVLQDSGLKIIESQNGQETYELAELNRPQLIITDLKMPVFDGFELLQRLRNNPSLKQIPVIATTASASIEEHKKVQVHNFDGILIKPIQINDVFMELMRFLPHTIDVGEPIADSPENIAITAVADADIRTVKRILENDLYNIWKTFENQQPLSEVEDFAYMLRDLGKKYNLDILISFGNRLLTSINNFDVDAMLKTLKDYTRLLATFKVVNEEE
jgi:two-component system sensor histidine kinase EvgS